MKALVIAATGSGAGKTSVSLGLCRALCRRGLRVQPAKVGPDFLDPTWLSRAAGRRCLNLDGWMMGADHVRALAAGVDDCDLLLIEGVMGCFDGADPRSRSGSTAEIAAWRRAHQQVPLQRLTELPFDCDLLLHGAYGTAEIKAALGLASLEKPGATGVGVIHAKEIRAYIHLVTFQKDDSDFSPTTRYRDYPISRTLLHWESQSNTTQASTTGQNYLHFENRGYTILFFARLTKRVDGETAPFLFLGQARALKSYHGNRPIAMTWELAHPMPAELFEEARPA
ncbi:MAG: DUF3427 domain-containing protein [Planctomycetota bacterium]